MFFQCKKQHNHIQKTSKTRRVNFFHASIKSCFQVYIRNFKQESLSVFSNKLIKGIFLNVFWRKYNIFRAIIRGWFFGSNKFLSRLSYRFFQTDMKEFFWKSIINFFKK